MVRALPPLWSMPSQVETLLSRSVAATATTIKRESLPSLAKPKPKHRHLQALLQLHLSQLPRQRDRRMQAAFLLAATAKMIRAKPRVRLVLRASPQRPKPKKRRKKKKKKLRLPLRRVLPQLQLRVLLKLLSNTPANHPVARALPFGERDVSDTT